MNIAVLSDSHDAWINLEWAVRQANDFKCDHLIFLGDLISPPGIMILGEFKGETHMIWGNNEGEKMRITSLSNQYNIKHYDWWFEQEFSERKIVAHHWPRPMEIAFQSRLFDLSLFGHTHEWLLNNNGSSYLLNPGALCNSKDFKPSMAIVDLSNMEINKIEM